MTCQSSLLLRKKMLPQVNFWLNYKLILRPIIFTELQNGPKFLTEKEAVQQGLIWVSKSKEIYPNCNALISSVPVLCVLVNQRKFFHIVMHL